MLINCASPSANRSLVWVEGDAYMHKYEDKEGREQSTFRVIQRKFLPLLLSSWEGQGIASLSDPPVYRLS